MLSEYGLGELTQNITPSNFFQHKQFLCLFSRWERKACGMVSGHLELVFNSGSFSVCYSMSGKTPKWAAREPQHMQSTCSPSCFLIFPVFIGRIFSLPKAELQMKAAAQSGRSSKTREKRERRWGQMRKTTEDNKKTLGSSAWYKSLKQKTYQGTDGRVAAMGTVMHPQALSDNKWTSYFYTDSQAFNAPRVRSISKYFSLNCWRLLFGYLSYSHSCFWTMPQMKIHLKSWYAFLLLFYNLKVFKKI